MFKPIACTLLVFSIFSISSADQIVNFDFVNVAFDGGALATGGFSWDFTTSTPTASNVSVGNVHFSLGGSYPSTITTSSFEGAYDYQQVSYNVALVFTNPITPTTGSTILFDPAQSYYQIDAGNPANFAAVSGSIEPQAVPEPKDLLPFGIVALVAMRRRSK